MDESRTQFEMLMGMSIFARKRNSVPSVWCPVLNKYTQHRKPKNGDTYFTAARIAERQVRHG